MPLIETKPYKCHMLFHCEVNVIKKNRKRTRLFAHIYNYLKKNLPLHLYTKSDHIIISCEKQ